MLTRLRGSTKINISKYLYRDRYLYILLIPGILYFIMFKYIPMGGLVIAFKDYNIFKGIFESPWVGFSNFKDLFVSYDFWMILRNTLNISILKILIGFPIPIILALLLNEANNKLFRKTTQSVLYLPHFISWTIIGGIMLSFFSLNDSVFSALINFFGGDPINYLASRKHFLAVIVFSDSWKESGWGTIIYMAALSQVDINLYEAAIVDGANRFKRTIHITLPSITGVMVLLLILRISKLMSAGFEQIYILKNPLVLDLVEIFDTYVFRVGFGMGRYSFTAAVDFFKSVVAMILILGADRFSKKLGEEGIL